MNTEQHKPFLHKEITYKIQGCCYNIRKTYGPGHKESVYHRLFDEEAQTANLRVEKEKRIPVYSERTGKVVGWYQPDRVVEDKIIIEIKATNYTTKQDEKQLYHYLRNTPYEVGCLVNFNTPRLYIKRIIYTNDRKPFLNKHKTTQM